MRISTTTLTFIYCILSSYAYGVDKEWTNTSGILTGWSVGPNWSPSGAPVDTDSIFFNGTATPNTSSNPNNSITPSAITFQNGVNCSLTGGDVTIGGSCPIIYLDNSSSATWNENTVPTIGGNLQLSTHDSMTGGSITFWRLNGTGNLTVDEGVSCTFNGRNFNWMASTLTVNGTLEIQQYQALPTASSLILGDNTNALFRVGPFFDLESQRLVNITGGQGGVIRILESNPTRLRLTDAVGTCNASIKGSGQGDSIHIDSSGTYILGGTDHNFVGQIYLQTGTLQASVNNALPPAVYFLSNEATVLLDLNGTSNTVAGISGGGNLGGNISLGTGGSLQIALNPGSQTFDGVISDDGAVSVNGDFIQTFTGINTYSGGTTIHPASTLALSGSGSLLSTGSVEVNGTFDLRNITSSTMIGDLSGAGTIRLGTKSLTVGNGNTTTFSGSIQGISGSSFTIDGSSTLILDGNNTYSSDTIIAMGSELIASSDNALSPSSDFTVEGNLVVNASNTIQSLSGMNGGINLSTINKTLTITEGGSFGGDIIGPGELTLAGGLLTFSGTNTYSGLTTINAGSMLKAGIMNGFSPNSRVLTLSGGTLNLSDLDNTVGALSGSGNVILGMGELTISDGDNRNFSGTISGDMGNLVLSNGTLSLSGNNTYTGTTTIDGGATLTAGANNTFASNSDFTVDGTLSLISYSNTIGSLAGSGTVNLGTGTLSVANGSGISFPGTITNASGNFTLETGMLTLTGANDYMGVTTVKSGATLIAGSATAFGTSSLVTESGGTIDFQDNAMIDMGDITNSGTMSTQARIEAASFTQTGVITLDFSTMSPPPFGKFVTTGEIRLAGTLNVTNSGMFMPSVGQQGILFESTGFPRQLYGKFDTENLVFGKLRYNYITSRVILWAGNCDATWDSTSDGDWNLMANWDPCIPGLSGMASNTDTANFIDLAMAPSTLHVDLAGVDVLLNDLSFDATSTSYIIQDTMGGGSISFDRPGSETDDPTLNLFSGEHTIDVPIMLEKDTDFFIGLGTLNLGMSSSIGSTGTWSLAEGASSGGVLNNYGTISPSDVNIGGTTLNNYGTISPSSFTLTGIANTNAVLNNFGTATGNTVIIGGTTGGTVLSNTGSITSATTFSILSGTVVNNSGGTLSAGSGSTLTISGGSSTNNQGATFGSSDADLMLNGGTLATSGQVLAKNFTQSGTGTLQMNVSSPTSFGTLSASEVATLGTNFIVYADPNLSLSNGDVLELITASGGRVNQFGSVQFQNFPASIIPSLVYLDNGVQLDIRESNFAMTQGTASLATAIGSGQKNFFLAIKMDQMRSRMQQPSSAVAIKQDFAKEDLIAAKGSSAYHKKNGLIAQQPGILQKESQLSERAAKQTAPWSVYAGPIGTFGSVDSKGAQVGMGFASAGGLVGFDTVFPDEEKPYHAGCGAMLAYQKQWCKIDSNWGKTDVDLITLNLYGTVLPKALPDFSIEAVLGGAYGWDEIERRTGINQSLTARADTHELLVNALLGFEYTLSGMHYCSLPRNLSLIPFAIFQYVIDFIDGYTESGAGIYNLRVNSFSPQSFTSLLGSRFQYVFNSKCADVRLELDAAWQHQYLNESLIIETTAFNFTNLAASAPTVAPGRNSLVVALDLLTTFSGGWQLETNCTYQLNSLFYSLYFYQGFGRQF